jgi:hypothetical protein
MTRLAVPDPDCANQVEPAAAARKIVRRIPSVRLGFAMDTPSLIVLMAAAIGEGNLQ